MKPRLILLSDLWGHRNDVWQQFYIDKLSQRFNVSIIDATMLASIDKSCASQEQLHAIFVQGGIDRAVSKLIQTIPHAATILAFSIGGTIAWKAAMQGLYFHQLFAVSATRLRKETKRPNGEIFLFFGENDPYQPNQEWFEHLQLKNYQLKHATHELYRQKMFASQICQMITEKA